MMDFRTVKLPSDIVRYLAFQQKVLEAIIQWSNMSGRVVWRFEIQGETARQQQSGDGESK